MIKKKTVGSAKRAWVRLPLGGKCEVWDCRRFGLGRIVSPKLPIQIELVPGTYLHLTTGVITSVPTSHVMAA